MALYRPYENESGVAMSYWMVNDFQIDRSETKVAITVVPYASEAARLAGKSPILNEKKKYYIRDFDYTGTKYEEQTNLEYTETFSPQKIEESGVDIYKMLYAYLKTVEFFSEAEDV